MEPAILAGSFLPTAFTDVHSAELCLPSVVRKWVSGTFYEGAETLFQIEFFVSESECRAPLRWVSGRPGRLPARAPHRSGRAEFPHPALQTHGFAAGRLTATHPLVGPAQLSDAVSLRRYRGSMPSPSSPPPAPCPGAPFPPPGRRGFGSPDSSVLWNTPTSCHPSWGAR